MSEVENRIVTVEYSNGDEPTYIAQRILIEDGIETVFLAVSASDEDTAKTLFGTLLRLTNLATQN